MLNGTNYSLADISAATRNSDDGFGCGNGGFIWLLLILLIAGGNGFGWGNNGDGGVASNYVLASDFSQLSRQVSDGFSGVGSQIINGFTNTTSQLNRIGDGIASLGYDQLAQMNGINMNIMNSATGIQRDIADLSYANQNCCCQTKQAISDAASAIIANDNANFRSLHDEIVANRMQDKDAQISALQSQLNMANLAASQCAQTATLVDQLGTKTPVAAYVVANPYCNCGYSNY